jgi:S-adenosylmethionine-dependent methyltransferase
MPASATIFDNSMTRWKKEMNLPWGKLKYKLVQNNLAKHLRPGSLHILDAGGGNGLDALPLAAQGHFVEIVDYSQEMLADVQNQAAHFDVQKQVMTHLADVRNLSGLFPKASFDLILCHNVLQYMDDVPELFMVFSELLKPGGMISVVSINRYSVPYQAAFFEHNLTEALAQLETRTLKAKIFDSDITSYCADEIIEMMRNVGILTEKDYGIRCICDYWGDNEQKLVPEIFAQIEKLELALTELHPYKLLARYFQVIGRKNTVIEG